MVDEPCQYGGLSKLSDISEREMIVGLRLGSIALFLISSALPGEYYPDLIAMLDSFFPGEFGEINHGRHFVTRFKRSLMRTLKRYVYWDLHAKLPALGLPSDYAVISDGITASNGCALHAHIAAVEGRCGRMQLHLLGLEPVSEIMETPDTRSLLTTVRFSTARAIFQQGRSVEESYGISTEMSRSRWAVRIGDGHEEGPVSIGVSRCAAEALKLPPSSSWGALDAWHAAEKSGEHSDSGSDWLISAYLTSARAMRARFNFGAQAAIPAKELRPHLFQCCCVFSLFGAALWASSAVVFFLCLGRPCGPALLLCFFVVWGGLVGQLCCCVFSLFGAAMWASSVVVVVVVEFVVFLFL